MDIKDFLDFLMNYAPPVNVVLDTLPTVQKTYPKEFGSSVDSELIYRYCRSDKEIFKQMIEFSTYINPEHLERIFTSDISYSRKLFNECLSEYIDDEDLLTEDFQSKVAGIIYSSNLKKIKINKKYTYLIPLCRMVDIDITIEE